jgi:hypothetical protein
MAKQESLSLQQSSPSCRRNHHALYHLIVLFSFLIAVQDYQNFLSSGKQEVELTVDCPSVILRPLGGSTPLADALVEMGMGGDLLLTPDQDLPESLGGRSEFPIYITLPPTQLVDFLTSLPESYKARPDDFVFFAGGVEYGNIEDILKDRGEAFVLSLLCLLTIHSLHHC